MLRFLLPLLLLPCSIAARQEDPICIQRLRNAKAKREVCVVVDDATAKKLSSNNSGIDLTLRRLERENACVAFPLIPGSKGQTVVVLSGECSLRTMMRNARSAGFSGLMVVANLSVYPERLDIGSDPKQIPVIVIASNLYLRLMGKEAYTFPSLILLPTLKSGRGAVPILIFPLITFFCLAVGMWFSVNGKADVLPNFIVGGRRQRVSSSPDMLLVDTNDFSALPPQEKSCSNWSGAVCVVFFVAFSAGWMLLLYFFYDIFVWFVIVIICMLFTFAFKSLIMEAVVRIFRSSNERCTLHIRNSCLRHFIGEEALDKRGLAILPFCAIPAILWLIYRKTMYGLLLQDICGVVACIYIIKRIRFGSLKTLVFFGALLFIYDIIMVYITPFFLPARPAEQPLSGFAQPLFPNSSVSRVRRSTDRGLSVMEAVATGQAGSSGEKLPLLLAIPSINFDGSYSFSLSRSTHEPCYFPTIAMIGFGDIIAPGMLLAYAHWCDHCLKSPDRRLPWLYSAAGLIGYQVGLGLVYVLLFVMRSGQPALLMLIPCTVLPFVLIAAVRRELAAVWSGVQDPEVASRSDAAVGGDIGEGSGGLVQSAEEETQQP